VTVILLSLLLTTITSHGTLRADATLVDTIPGEQTWTHSLYDLENFTIIALPDTQYYSESYPEVFDSQTQWIVDNIETMNIIFVTHLGDIVDEWWDLGQWENANHSLSMLDGIVPYGVLLGNHDGVGSDQTNFEEYFGSDRFSNESWYGGAYQSNNRNNYQLFSAGGDDYLILHLQYDPSDDVLAWASDIIDNYPTRRVILSTHEYIAWPWEGWRSPIGENIYQKLVKPHADQIFLVLCGHLDVEDHRTATVDEHTVHEIITDYQEQSNGGNGWLKILEFSPLQDKIFVKTYSPYLDAYHPNADSQFTLDYEMTSTQASITVLSNSTLSDFAFDRSLNQISFNASGEAGTAGYSNVSIPQDLLPGTYLSLRIDEELQSYAYYQNVTHTSLYFKYTHQDVLQVTINGNGVIPEFAPVIILPLFIIATLIAIIFSKRKLRAYRSMNG
jgi:hypothetical protein